VVSWDKKSFFILVVLTRRLLLLLLRRVVGVVVEEMDDFRLRDLRFDLVIWASFFISNVCM